MIISGHIFTKKHIVGVSLRIFIELIKMIKFNYSGNKNFLSASILLNFRRQFIKALKFYET